MYAFEVSTAIGFVEVTAATKFSLAEPPKYVEYRNAVPLVFNFATNASNAPPLLSCSGETVGRLAEDVKPVRYTPVEFTATPVARSSPLPPK